MSSCLAKPKQNIRIQLLRALAIICVVIIHTIPENDALKLLVRPFVNISVALFIFLSGYLTPIDVPDVLGFYKKRILRVLIPYVIWSVVYTLFSGDYSKIIVNLITSKSAVQMYYILIYIQLVLLTPLLKKLACSKFRFVGWLITPVMTIIFKYIPLFMGIKLPPTVSLIWGDLFFGWFTFYYLGILLGNHIIQPEYKNWKLAIGYGLSIFLQIGEAYLWYSMGKSNYETQVKFSAFLTSALFLLIAYNYIEKKTPVKNNFAVKAIKLIGDCSFGIYLSHILIIKLLKMFVPFYESIPFCLNSILDVCLALLIVVLFRKICGKKVGKYLGFY